MMLNCLITGVGGQGTVLMSRLIGAAAIERGFEVRGSETIGMAQRGGSVVSHLRIGKGIHSPLIPPGKADVIIAFENTEAVRVLPFLSPYGKMMVLDWSILPVSAHLKGKPYEPKTMLKYLEGNLGGEEGWEKSSERLTVIDRAVLLERCGNGKALNVALLGAAVERKFFPFDARDIEQAIRSRLPPKFVEMNLKALAVGREIVR
ncbi:MAG: indolepyruvate oxidoreductase subunit beta [Treponema sp.]|jgi:indolepyruvate ferredoxin oxidoreductase beta subunit|nr:indolepyruvate oxidoreductase subunit beta [Treponema sp.]